jgi:hypothetical protein
MYLDASFDWKLVNSKKFGNMFIPYAEVEMKSIFGEWKRFYVLIDTGAPISVFSINDCELLGYEIVNDDPYGMRGALNGEYPSYIHKLDLKIGKKIFQSRIAFTLLRHNMRYLGLLDIFDKFDVSFLKNQKTYFV